MEQVLSYGLRQIPHTSSSGMSHRQAATAFHSLIVTFIVSPTLSLTRCTGSASELVAQHGTQTNAQGSAGQMVCAEACSCLRFSRMTESTLVLSTFTRRRPRTACFSAVTHPTSCQCSEALARGSITSPVRWTIPQSVRGDTNKASAPALSLKPSAALTELLTPAITFRLTSYSTSNPKDPLQLPRCL